MSSNNGLGESANDSGLAIVIALKLTNFVELSSIKANQNTELLDVAVVGLGLNALEDNAVKGLGTLKVNLNKGRARLEGIGPSAHSLRNRNVETSGACAAAATAGQRALGELGEGGESSEDDINLMSEVFDLLTLLLDQLVALLDVLLELAELGEAGLVERDRPLLIAKVSLVRNNSDVDGTILDILDLRTIRWQ